MKTNIYGNTFLNSSSQENKNWITFQTYFNPLFGEKPKEVNVQFGSVFLSIEDPKTIELDDSKEYPRTFEYAGSTISIDKVKVGDEVRVVINDNEIKNRKYDSLIFRVVGDEGNETMNIISKDVFVDKNGVEYNTFVPYKKIGQLRHFTKVKSIVLSNNAGEKLVPKRLEIDGYVATKYLDNVVKLKLGKKRQVPRSGYN